MVRRNRAAVIFIVLGLIFALAALPNSAAINDLLLDRQANVKLADDNNGILKLVGFQNMLYERSGNYESFGSITNHTGRTIILTVTVIPDFQITHYLSRLGIKIGDETCEFWHADAASKQLKVTMSPGQTLEAKAYLTTNFFYSLQVDFQFEVTDTAGDFSMKLMSTTTSPRRIYLY